MLQGMIQPIEGWVPVTPSDGSLITTKPEQVVCFRALWVGLLDGSSQSDVVLVLKDGVTSRTLPNVAPGMWHAVQFLGVKSTGTQGLEIQAGW